MRKERVGESEFVVVPAVHIEIEFDSTGTSYRDLREFGNRRGAELTTYKGTFAGLASLVPYPDINEFFTTDYRARQADGRRSAGSA